MLYALRLLLPALAPSWRFFASVGPSPRIQYMMLAGDGREERWVAWRPRPLRIPPHEMVWRLVWNPARNDALFAVSCVERLLECGDSRWGREIVRRVCADLTDAGTDAEVQVRVMLVRRNGERLTCEEAWRSQPIGLAEGAAL